MSRFLPSPSKLDLAARCLFPWIGGIRWPKRARGVFASLGVAFSSVAECCAAFGEAPLDAIADANELEVDSAERRSFMYGADHIAELLELEAKTDRWRAAELVVAWNVVEKRGRILPQRERRDYSALMPGEIAGPLDLARITGDGELVIRDWKSGQYARGKDPAKMLQLLTYAVALADALSFDRVRIELSQVDELGVYTKAGELDAFGMAIHASELEQLFARLDDPTAKIPTPGRHCSTMFCPIVAECPATQTAVDAIDDASRLRLPIVGELETVEQAAYTLDRVEAVEAALKSVGEQVGVMRAAIKLFAAKTPIPRGDGLIYAPRESEREDLKATAEALAVLQAELGDELVGETFKIKRELLKGGLKRACKKKAPARKGAELERQIMKRLRAVGAVSKSTFQKFETFKPKQEKEERTS